MRKEVHFAVIALAVFVCVLLVALNAGTGKKLSTAILELDRCRNAMADLEERTRKAESERDAASQKVAALELEVSGLIKQQKEDRLLIQDLWNTLSQSPRTEAKQALQEPATAKRDQRDVVKYDEEERTVKYNAEAVRKMIPPGGGFKDAIRRIVTPEGIDSTLREHSDEPLYWVAAATVVQDEQTALAYIEEAARLHPESTIALSSLVEARIAQGNVGESTLAHINELRTIDPTNALADCYAAYCQFKNGDTAGALQSLSQASVKDRFADEKMELLMARYDYFLNEGCSDSVAIGLSAFDLPFPHMGMLRDMGQYSMEQVRSFSSAGQYEDALQVVQDISSIGRSLSSSGRFIVYDRVGMALQTSAIEEQAQIYESLGDIRQAQEIDLQLQAIQERSAAIDVMVRAFGDVMQKMTDEDLASYVDQTIRNGEFSTLQSIPEIAEALEQAQKTSDDEGSETGTP